MWLQNSWYQAGWSDEVRPGESFVRTILGAPILFYRTDGSQIAALLDRCPHRFAPLSAGRIDGERVTCGYHGLSFDKSGRCVDNPHGSVTSSMKVRAFPIVERHTAIWVWMGDSERADEASIPDLSFIDNTPEVARLAGYMPTRANYQLLTDNILDLSHADYLHPTTLGGMMTKAKASTREEGDAVIAEWMAHDCEPPGAFRPTVPPGSNADIWTQVVWKAPALMRLSTSATLPGSQRRDEDVAITLHNMVPESPTSTHYFYCSTRRFLADSREFSDFLKQALATAFQDEDKPMLEKQQERVGDEDFWGLDPILLSIDAGAVRARRKLEKLIAAERQT